MKRNCPRCNEPVSEFSEVCQICGYALAGNHYQEDDDFDSIHNELIRLTELVEKGLLPCKISFIQKSNGYTFITIEKFVKFGHLGHHIKEHNSFYVFKSQLHMDLNWKGQKLVWNLEDFDYFVTDNDVKIYYLKREMISFDIQDLKTYNFNKGRM